MIHLVCTSNFFEIEGKFGGGRGGKGNEALFLFAVFSSAAPSLLHLLNVSILIPSAAIDGST